MLARARIIFPNSLFDVMCVVGEFPIWAGVLLGLLLSAAITAVNMIRARASISSP